MRRSVLGLAAIVACAPPGPDPRTPLDISPFVAGEVLLKLEPGHTASDVEALGARMGAYAVRPSSVDGWWYMAIDAARDPREAAAALEDRAEVARAQPNQRRVPFRVPNDFRYLDQWSHQQTEAEAGWDIEIGDPSVIVAVIGTGVAIDHQDLRNNVFLNRAEIPGNGRDDDGNGFVDDLTGWDFAEGDSDPRPTLSDRPSFEERAIAAHETLVAGIIGASGNNAIGIVGAAWDVSLLPIKFDYTTAQSAEAIDYARRMGARVVNMSYGSAIEGEVGRDPFEEETIDLAFQQGVVFVAASGNDGHAGHHYPAAYPNVLSTGATRRDGQRADFSNFGDTVDVSAPGEQVISTFLGGGFSIGDGTSLSAPYVSGVAALVAARHPGWTATDIRRALLYTGDKTYPDYYSGTRVNVRRAVALENPPLVFARFVTPFARAQFPRGGVASFDGYAVGSRYVIEAQRTGTRDWVELFTGTSTIGQIARFDTSALDIGEYRVRLRCTAGAEVDVDFITVVIATGALLGWPTVLDGTASAPGMIGDLDGDGAPEVLAPMIRRGVAELHVLKADGTPVFGWPVRLPGRGSSAPVLVDLDGDDRLDIVIGTERGLVAFHADGTPATAFPVTDAVRGLALGDLDADDQLDIVVTENGQAGRAWALRVDGSAFGGWPVTLEPELSAPAVGDFDGDGFAEIAVIGSRRIHLLRANGTSFFGAPVFVDGLEGATVAAADMDGDGRAELLIARDTFTPGRPELGTQDAWDRRVSVLDLAGRPLRGFPYVLQRDRVSPNNEARLSAGDLNGDGRPEIMVGVGGEMWAFSGNGASLPRWPARASSPNFSVGTVGDVDGDGTPELLTVAPGASLVVAFDSRAHPASGFPLTARGDGAASPMITDLDGDGNVDVVLPGVGIEAFALAHRHDLGSGEWPLPGRDSMGSRFLPPRFPLEITARGPRDLALAWTAPHTISPTRYRVERDRQPMATTTTREHVDVVGDPAAEHTYRVLAIDAAGNLLARSVDVTTTADERWCAGQDGRACDDGDGCTTNDACSNGTCSAGSAAPDGTRCDDGNACTRADACLEGQCTSSDVVTCEGEPGSCQVAVCDPQSGACVASARANGEACDDHNACTNNDVCWMSACRGDDLATDLSECDDGNPCTALGVCRNGFCDGAFPLAMGTPCEDNNTCTAPGRCVEDQCVDQTVLADGTSCEDGNSCSLGDVCGGGVCIGGNPVRCGGDDQCVAGSSCNPRSGVCRPRLFPDRAPCDDGSACTEWDTCLEGICTGEAPVICVGAGEACDPTSGRCVAPVEIVQPSGCGCTTSGSSPTALFLLAFVLLRRSRP